jgi:hypothetical protein
MAEKMSGVLSDNDVKFLTQATTGLSTTPEGRRLILEAQRLTAQRAADAAKFARSYNGGRLDANFEDAMAERYQSKDLFSPDFIRRAQEAAGQSAKSSGGASNILQQLPPNAQKGADGYYRWKDEATGRMIRAKPVQ